MIWKEEKRRIVIQTWNPLERNNRSQIKMMIRRLIMDLIRLKRNLMTNLLSKKRSN